MSRPLRMPLVPPKRCAVYCCVSSDERLDQSFNSIDAQREAGHSTVNELLRLTLLEPAIIQAILAGKQPRCMSLLWFRRNAPPTDWAAQREALPRFDA